MNSRIRIGLALLLGFLIGIVIPLANGKEFASAFKTGVVFALLIGAIVAILSWAMDLAVEKGYPSWLGFVLALFLNIIGLLILVILPAQAHSPTS
jgi:hypothetical protein